MLKYYLDELRLQRGSVSCALLGCDTVWSYRCSPPFRRKVSSPSSELTLKMEVDGAVIL
jgi:hypothetical protein